MRIFTRILGIFLLVEGIWGLFSPVVFGVFTTSTTHAVIHIMLGITGILLAKRARGYLFGVGLLLTVCGVLFFVPAAAWFTAGLFNEDLAVACFDIVVGLTCLAFALTSWRHAVPAT